MNSSNSADAGITPPTPAPHVASDSVAVVIVTYASESVLGDCLAALMRQTQPPDLVVVVDNNSPDPSYLESIPADRRFVLVRNEKNVGFCGGNNIGYRLARAHTFVLFLNPDAFLTPSFIEHALARISKPGNHAVGALTGTLLGFDVRHQRPTGRIDSTGVFQTWYGRWYDRGQGMNWSSQSKSAEPEDVPAICGALMLCRTQALEDAALRPEEVFDPAFFMYKEDIDLSLRLRRKGWRLLYEPALLCYHGRGWQKRRAMSHHARYLSAKNELRLSARNAPIGLPYSLAKYAFVASIERILSIATRALVTLHRRWKARSIE
jgi:N-acetylglucosaminyl-diphospho-decaprenol L-rhamnosyltransferase